jgi:DNA-binding transcriptional ArsR family regulator
MRFVAESGIVLDTLWYNMMFFNQEIIEYRHRMFFDNAVTPLYWFDQFRTGKRKIEPLDRWLPFFQYRNDNYEFFPVFSYFWTAYDFEKNDAIAFFESMRSEAFKRCCFEHYLKAHASEINIDAVLCGDLYNSMRALLNLGGQSGNQKYFVDFLCIFDELVNELIPYFVACYRKMRHFHENIVPEKLERFSGVFVSSAAQIKKMHGLEEGVTLSEHTFSVILMEHLALFCKRLRGERFLFLMGGSGEGSIQMWQDTLGITLNTLGREFGDEVKWSIVQELRKGEKTASQLSKTLYISRSTVDRSLQALRRMNIAAVSRKIGVEVFFRLNPTFFFAAKAKIKVDIDEILEDICHSDVFA